MKETFLKQGNGQIFILYWIFPSHSKESIWNIFSGVSREVWIFFPGNIDRSVPICPRKGSFNYPQRCLSCLDYYNVRSVGPALNAVWSLVITLHFVCIRARCFWRNTFQAAEWFFDSPVMDTPKFKNKGLFLWKMRDIILWGFKKKLWYPYWVSMLYGVNCLKRLRTHFCCQKKERGKKK